MAPVMSTLSLFAGLQLLQFTSQAYGAAIDTRASTSPYAPVAVSCPSTPLVRAASGLSSSESTYITARKTAADTSLAAWLTKTNSAFATTSLPKLGLAVSGGGLRATLGAAGVVQAFDSRDSTSGVAGIYQSLTYHSALSGGGWMTGSLIGNNWPTVSSLESKLWYESFEDTLLLPENLLFAVAYAEIVADVLGKFKAGFNPTLVDVYGRLLGYQLLEGSDGGVATGLSDVTGFSQFTSHAVPFPIFTARGLLPNQCVPNINATEWEFTPYEFGSWDEGVKAFTQTTYLGSALTNGSPTVPGVCISNYDNLGYIMATSSDVFNAACAAIPAINSTNNLDTTLSALLAKVEAPVERDIFAAYPNPFYKYENSALVSAETELYLVDGGEEDSNVPLWPLIQPARDVDVIIMGDNSGDTTLGYPNGTELIVTYQQAKMAGLTRMPFIPSADVIVAKGLNERATFFGCDDADAATLVWLPNKDYTYASNTSTFDLQYSKAQTAAMIANANLVATQDGDANWPTCLGCAIMKKTDTTLPTACTACFTKYCYSA